MGSPITDPYYDDDEKQQTVRVNSFYMGVSAVTVGDFKEFTASTGYKTTAERNGKSFVLNRQFELEMTEKINWSNPSFSQFDNYPVVHISLLDAMEYCNWRSRQEGLRPVYAITGNRFTVNTGANGYRLPSEAEWEYACRAGTTTSFNTGSNSITTAQANFINSFNLKPSSVNNFSANNWGLYDMHGNVYEWTHDNYEDSELFTARGGSWFDGYPWLRSAFRLPVDSGISAPILGFRIVRSAS